MVAYKLSIGSGIALERLVATASFRYLTQDGEREDTFGTANIQVSQVTLNAPRQLATLATTISGLAPAGSTVRAYDSTVLLGQTVASKFGYWRLQVTLPDLGDPALHTLRAEADTAAGTIYTRHVTLIRFDSALPQLLELCMQQVNRIRICFDPSQGLARFAYIVTPNKPITFELRFNNPNAVHDAVVTLDGFGGGQAKAALDADGIYRVSITPALELLGSILVDYGARKFNYSPDWQPPTEQELRHEVLPPFMSDYVIESVSAGENTASLVVKLPQFNDKVKVEMVLEGGKTFTVKPEDAARVGAGGFPFYSLEIGHTVPADLKTGPTGVQFSGFIPDDVLDQALGREANPINLEPDDAVRLLKFIMASMQRMQPTAYAQGQPEGAVGGVVKEGFEFFVNIACEECADFLGLLEMFFEAGTDIACTSELCQSVKEKLNELERFGNYVQNSNCPQSVKDDFQGKIPFQIALVDIEEAGVGLLGASVSELFEPESVAQAVVKGAGLSYGGTFLDGMIDDSFHFRLEIGRAHV